MHIFNWGMLLLGVCVIYFVSPFDSDLIRTKRGLFTTNYIAFALALVFIFISLKRIIKGMKKQILNVLHSLHYSYLNILYNGSSIAIVDILEITRNVTTLFRLNVTTFFRTKLTTTFRGKLTTRL